MTFKKIKKIKKTKNNKRHKNKKTRKNRKKSGGGNYFKKKQQNQMNTITRKMIGFESAIVRPVMNLKGVVRIGDQPVSTP
jgi:hypothetical protein